MTRAPKRPPAISAEERAKRRPPPPMSLIEDVPDTVRVPSGRLIKATPIRLGPVCTAAAPSESGCALWSAGSTRCKQFCGWASSWESGRKGKP